MDLYKQILLLSVIIIVEGCEDQWGSKVLLDVFKQRDEYEVGESYEVFSGLSKNNITSHLIQDHDDCVGLTTITNETIVLHCPGNKQQEPGCFDIIPFKSSFQNNTELTSKQAKICGQILEVSDGHIVGCVIGLKTKDGSIIIFLWTAIVSPLAASVPNNSPPDKMK